MDFASHVHKQRWESVSGVENYLSLETHGGREICGERCEAAAENWCWQQHQKLITTPLS